MKAGIYLLTLAESNTLEPDRSPKLSPLVFRLRTRRSSSCFQPGDARMYFYLRCSQAEPFPASARTDCGVIQTMTPQSWMSETLLSASHLSHDNTKLRLAGPGSHVTASTCGPASCRCGCVCVCVPFMYTCVSACEKPKGHPVTCIASSVVLPQSRWMHRECIWWRRQQQHRVLTDGFTCCVSLARSSLLHKLTANVLPIPSTMMKCKVYRNIAH